MDSGDGLPTISPSAVFSGLIDSLLSECRGTPTVSNQEATGEPVVLAPLARKQNCSTVVLKTEETSCGPVPTPTATSAESDGMRNPSSTDVQHQLNQPMFTFEGVAGVLFKCPMTMTVSCECGNSKKSMTCGAKLYATPPSCGFLCQKQPNCHHSASDPHQCHFGPCPPCKEICGRVLADCPHVCTARCHCNSAIVTEVRDRSQLEFVTLPCPPCSLHEEIQKKSPMCCLEELGHKQGFKPKYDLISTEGRKRDRTFLFRVNAAGFVGEGKGVSKQMAKHAAAAELMNKLPPLDISPPPKKRKVLIDQ